MESSPGAEPPAPRRSLPSRSPSPWASAEGRMILVFDVLWTLSAPLVWGPPLVAAGLVVNAGAAVGWWLGLAVAPVAYLVLLTTLCLNLGWMKAVLPKETPGTSRVFGDRAFFVFLLHWGLEKYVPAPFITHIQLLTGLRLLYYRLMGTQLGWSTHISPGATVWNPGLMQFGHLTYIGDFAHLSGHLSQGDKLLMAPIVVGDQSNIGAHTNVGPGCNIGARVRVGALCDLAPGVEIEDDVEMGPRCQVGMGVKIGAGARIEPRTFLDSWATVPPGEIWGGDPARKVGDVPKSRGERRRRKRRWGKKDD
jgi:acetyltransferase-like isoleucine patch superfamily enzyme